MIASIGFWLHAQSINTEIIKNGFFIFNCGYEFCCPEVLAEYGISVAPTLSFFGFAVRISSVTFKPAFDAILIISSSVKPRFLSPRRCALKSCSATKATISTSHVARGIKAVATVLIRSNAIAAYQLLNCKIFEQRISRVKSLQLPGQRVAQSEHAGVGQLDLLGILF